MDKAHDLKNLSVTDRMLRLEIDGRKLQFNLGELSDRLARASKAQQANVEISPSGYGLHWPDLDEDLSIDGLLGITHAPARAETGP